MLLEYHASAADYLFVFDYHDDLVILDSEVSPAKYSFFQIKTKDKGNWTLNKILKRDKTKKEQSILGKMYNHLILFPKNVHNISIISNAGYSIELKNGKNGIDEESIVLEEMSDDEKKVLEDKLIEEFSITDLDKTFETICCLKKTTLSRLESSTHTKGKISEFLNARHPGKKINPELIYKNLFDEIKTKTAYEKQIKDFDELKKFKGIGKAAFDEILRIIGDGKDYDQIWHQIQSTLSSEGMSFGDIIGYKDEWKKLEVDRMNPDNNILKQLIMEVDKTITDLKSKNGLVGLKLMEAVQAVSSNLTMPAKSMFTNAFIETTIICALNE